MKFISQIQRQCFAGAINEKKIPVKCITGICTNDKNIMMKKIVLCQSLIRT